MIHRVAHTHPCPGIHSVSIRNTISKNKNKIFIKKKKKIIDNPIYYYNIFPRGMKEKKSVTVILDRYNMYMYKITISLVFNSNDIHNFRLPCHRIV